MMLGRLERMKTGQDIFLLLSLLLVILMYPVLDHSDLGRLILAALVFVPVGLATLRMSQTKVWVRPSVMLMSSVVVFGVLSIVFPRPALLVIKWGIMTAFFALTVVCLFTYLKNARTILSSHLFTAVSIYVLIGMLYFSLYSAIDVFCPGAFQLSPSVATDRPSELLYFSLITLSTIGYGDIVPVYGVARMLAALEGMTGVLYVAIMIALLVSAFRWQGDARPE